MAMTPKEIIAVVQHFDAGGEVQVKYKGDQFWSPIVSPSWNFDENDYRPKPKPLELWVNVYPDGSYSANESQDIASRRLRIDGRTVHMREVVDE